LAKPPSGIARRRAAARNESNPAYLERRREIVTAAARVFKRKGLQGTNISDIAAEAGADRASLYYYAGSKEELFHEVVREAVEANLEIARAIQAGPGTAPQKIRELITSLMASYAENYPILYVFIQENLTHMPARHEPWARDMRRVNKDYEELIIQLVQSGFDEGSIRPVAPAWVIAFGIMGMLGWTNRWFNPEASAASAAEIAAAFADTILLGVEQTSAPAPGAPSRPPA
jgi:AcrR family transcriptional regulator